MRDWNMRHQNAGVEYAGVENVGVNHRDENARASGIVSQRESKSSHRTQNIDFFTTKKIVFVASAIEHTIMHGCQSAACSICTRVIDEIDALFGGSLD